MLEFAILSALLGIVLTAVGRTPPERVASRATMLVLSVSGWVAGALLEALPMTDVGRAFGWRTVLIGCLGLIVARLLFRVIQAWALSRRDWRELGPKPPRLTHPLILIGLFLTGIPSIFMIVVARHEALEVESMPRDEETLVVTGAETRHVFPDGATPPTVEVVEGEADPVRPERADGKGAVLLLHGFLSSPTDFGDLPDRLREDGYEVLVPRQPGHGTTPGRLADITAGDLREAAHASCAELIARHRRVSVVGFSMGGALALDLSDEFELEGLVLVNPYLGKLADRAWSPFSTDDLFTFLAPALHAVIRPDGMANLARPEGLHGHVQYRTVPLSTVRQLQVLAEDLSVERPVPTAPVLLLRSVDDGVVQPGPIDELKERLREDGVTVTEATYANSRHLLFRDYDAGDAVAAVREFLRER